MEVIQRSKHENNMVAKSESNRSYPALDEVIAAIDSEIDLITASETNKQGEYQRPETAQAAAQNQFIQFSLEDNLFALPLRSALEVGHRPEITPLPNLPNWVLGISNIRGEIISLVNLKILFGINSAGTKGDRRYIIINNHHMKVGIVVDEIPGILSLDRIEADIQNSPYRNGKITKFILGVSVSGERLINILDTDRLLSALLVPGFGEI